jgi:tRNA wybutosine-synthesizing protein 1
MDIGDGSVWLVIVADRVDRLISLWHKHRGGLCATIAVILILFILRARTRKLPVRVRDLSPASEEKASWLEVPKDKTGVTRLSESYERKGQAPRQPGPSLEPSRLSGPRVIAGQKPARAAKKTDLTTDLVLHKTQPLVFFSSLTGTAQRLATAFAENLKAPVLGTSAHP